MKLVLNRNTFTDKSTIGDLSVNGVHECYVIEDVDRDKNKDGDLADAGEAKVFGKTAIPRGTYKVVITMSNRFKRQLPLLVNVPGFTGVRIHTGNSALDTEGCLIVGNVKTKDYVKDSRAAFKKLFEKMLLTQEDIYITIK
ncbi:MAG: DUF5675 family protein [Bacteroidota bacterium]